MSRGKWHGDFQLPKATTVGVDIGVNGSGQNGSRRHARQSLVPKDAREFVVWDGEGAKSRLDASRPQEYVLLGYATETESRKIVDESLSTLDCLAFIVATGKRYPHAFHVGFAFDYDTNMIVRHLKPFQLRILRENGSVRVGKYRVEHVPGKWLQVTEYEDEQRSRKTTVRIADIFGFFQCSFVKAITDNIADHPLMSDLARIEEGKSRRNDFTYEQIEYITAYWSTEIRLLHALAIRLRERLYAVGLDISRWHGPGAIANFVYKTHGIARNKALTPKPVRDASRYAYAGGRFELFRLGRHEHVYSIDINSAYPFAISKLPSLAEGEWKHEIFADGAPRSFAYFGLYRVELMQPSITHRLPGPLFHRDISANISYPWMTTGWYWSPEVTAMVASGGFNRKNVRITEAYIYSGSHEHPFAFVKDMYEHRQLLKATGDGAQMALKLALNSLYGKMAQRVGWERNGKPPTWHQLEWAGWVTSYTRSMLYNVIARIPWEHLIAVETDGIYTTMNPADLGIKHSKELGGWEVKEYEEMLYVQSGVYFSRNSDGDWHGKYRGLDKDSLTHDMVADYLRSLFPMPTVDNAWPILSGPTTRFIGYQNAINREETGRGPIKAHHCRWETTPHEITAAETGKRQHSPKLCKACRAGATAYEMPHDLFVVGKWIKDRQSHMHSIPWEDDDNGESAEWRQYAKAHEGLISVY